MLPTLVFTEIRVEGWASMSKRDQNNASKAAWAKAGLWWLQQKLHKHFTRAAAIEYGYKRRNYDKSQVQTLWLVVRMAALGKMALSALPSSMRKLLNVALSAALSKAEKKMIYTLRKLHRQGKQPSEDADLPLVLTGTLRKETMASGRWTVRATKDGVRIGLPRPSHRLRQQQQDELRKVSPREKKALEAKFHEYLAAELNGFQGRKKVPLARGAA